jgi:hypothetical protein
LADAAKDLGENQIGRVINPFENAQNPPHFGPALKISPDPKGGPFCVCANQANRTFLSP